MRKLFVTLLGIFLIGTAANMYAYTPHALATQIQRQTAQARHQNKQPQSNLQASQNEPDSFFGLPIINYEDFKKYDQEERQRRSRFGTLSNQIFSAGTQSKFSALDYVAQTKNVRYVYIGELHFQPSIQEEVKRIITAVREANPNEKILLASEFFYRTHPLINPLHLEGTENILASVYPEFSKLADDLHMDTLALDDRIILFRNEDKASFVKMGDRLIRAENTWVEPYVSPLNDITAKVIKNPQSYVSTIRQAFLAAQSPQFFEDAAVSAQLDEYWEKYVESYSPGNEKFITGHNKAKHKQFSAEELTTWAEFWASRYFPLSSTVVLPTSAWGVKQRNLQWAQRIKEVENQYKIIIIWAGMGHLLLDSGYPFTLPFLISSSDAVEFEIFGTESQNEESDTTNDNPTRSNADKIRYTEITRDENAISQELQEKIFKLLNEEDESVKIKRPLRLPHKRFDLHLGEE